MSTRQITLGLVVVTVLGAAIGCSGAAQDGEMPKNDPIVGKPTDASVKDPNAVRAPEGATKSGFGK